MPKRPQAFRSTRFLAVRWACTSDILGNRLTKGQSAYSWDILNRMVGYNQTQYRYRADGMRVLKNSGSSSTRYRYDGQMGIEDVSGSVVTRYGLGARGVDYIEQSNGTGSTVVFPVFDAHGNNVASLSRNGLGYQVSNRRSFDAWGSVRLGSQTGDPTGRYCANLGHKQDDESGLVYMRARYYEPTSGRFISEDPAMDGGNWFVFCGNDPVNYADYTGRARRTEYSFGDWKISLDPSGGDWHAYLNGEEVLSRGYLGNVKHKLVDRGEKMMRKLIDAINDGIRAGNQKAIAVGKKMRANGIVGISEHLHFAIVAITSIDAYAQYDPVDFADILATIGGLR